MEHVLPVATSEITVAGTSRVPAFPGAQGGGSLSKGGRGGRVYEVTSLDDSGAGSLRECVQASGPRTCVFRVAGTVVLRSVLRLRNPYITIAGQTSPGGVQVRAAKTSGEGGPFNGALVQVVTHDVVIRYLRLRHGRTDPVDNKQNGHPIKLNDGAYNVIVDHCSIYWTQDENVGIWTIHDPIHDVTFSWNIVTEPLHGHPTNFAIAADRASGKHAQMVNLDFHHNFIGTSSHRNPNMTIGTTRWINNVIYNFSSRATQIGGATRGDLIGNIYRLGPASGSARRVREIVWRNDPAYPGSPSLYVFGNKSSHHPDPAATGSEWSDMVGTATSENGADTGPLSAAYRRTTPLPAAGVPMVAEPASTLEASMGLAGAGALFPVGASRRLDANGAWVDASDSNDRRVIQEYRTNTAPSALPNDGTPSTIAAGTPYRDADHDGMPDAWERAHGLDPSDASDGNRTSSDGNTNLERFLNGQPHPVAAVPGSSPGPEERDGRRKQHLKGMPRPSG
jgi:pectate lyase